MKVFMSTPMEVPDSHKDEGQKSVTPPLPIPVEATVKEVLSSPAKKVSVAVRIVQIDGPRTVHVRGEKVPIKTITLETGTDRAKVTLWHECSSSTVRPGDHIKLIDVVVNSLQQSDDSSNNSVL